MLLSTIAIMPFWYMNLYLFKNDFFTKSPIQMPIIISFCLTIVYLIINGVITLCIQKLAHSPRNAFMFSLGSISILSFTTFMEYIFKFNFSYYLGWIFGIGIIKAVIFMELTKNTP